MRLWAYGGDYLTGWTGSYDSTVKLWDTKSRSERPLMSFSEAKDSISSLDVLGHELTAGCVDGRVRTYDLRMGQIDVDVLGRKSHQYQL